MPAAPLERYLRRMAEIRSSGAATQETSFYAPLEALLNAAGEGLDPHVRAVFQLKNIGAGHPDGGLFTAEQLWRETERPAEGALPERGVVEVKGPGEALEPILRGEQVEKYWRRYGQVLVTNYRRFAFIGAQDGMPAVLETFALAESEDAFWNLARAARAPAARAGARADAPALDGRLMDFLQRVLLYAAPLGAPQDVAWFLASYAREARARLDAAGLDRLGELRAALEEALGLRFTGRRGERFFRATVVQTLFYGLFSAWVLWHRAPESRATDFTWHGAGLFLRVPVMQVLFGHMAMPHRVQRLDLVDILARASAMLNRVDRAAFFARFDERDAIQYFYEPFLEAFDPQLRKELGVWYTPRPVVRYMVERVDRALRTELGVADGLADPHVVVLDPCCGTGAYLVAVLDRIARTLEARGEGAMTGLALKEAATRRLFGFEILTAPFVVAHLQLGLFLREQGVPLAEAERAGVFLTNALTGWQPAEHPKLPFKELAEEREQADRVKQEQKILVILGNPPYDGYPGIAEMDEERALTQAYRATAEHVPAPKGQGLNDLYVRFFRVAERQIAEKTGRGLVCFISNYSWLDGLSHPGMRERYLTAFDSIWIDSLNGDKYRTGKTTPEGRPDPSIFSTQYNREGIQVGTAVTLLARTGEHVPADAVHYRDLWGKAKLEQLDAEARGEAAPAYEHVQPPAALGYPFAPRALGADYLSWPKLPELFPASFPGVKTSRDDALVDIDRDRLEARIATYLNPEVPDEVIAREIPRLMKTTSSFDAEHVRTYLLNRGERKGRIVRYCYRPFDVRWLYWEPETKLLDRERADYVPHVFDGNVWIEARQRDTKEFDRGYCTTVLADNFGAGLSNFFPLYLAPDAPGGDLFTQAQPPADGRPTPNLSARAGAYLAPLYPDELPSWTGGVPAGRGGRSAPSGADQPDQEPPPTPPWEGGESVSAPRNPSAIPPTPETLFHHVLAVLHAPAYREENAGALRQDWPRVPLPEDAAALEASAALGREVAVLLDVERPARGVTTGTVRPVLRGLGVPAHVAGKQLDPGAGHFDVTAGWGYMARGATMPGKGRAEVRPYTDAEIAALPGDYAERLGADTCDLYLNEAVCWRCVPAHVWGYTLGGYPVLKKWLSYREKKVLGRPLRREEVVFFMQAARRLAALLLLEPALDANYAAARQAAAA